MRTGLTEVGGGPHGSGGGNEPGAFAPSAAGGKPAGAPGRGMITASGDVFQLDGNLGFLAAVNEALLQSHRGSWVFGEAMPSTSSTGVCAITFPRRRLRDAADPVELHLLPALPPLPRLLPALRPVPSAA